LSFYFVQERFWSSCGGVWASSIFLFARLPLSDGGLATDTGKLFTA